VPEPALISCLCVTRNRVPFLRRAVACFLAQTYRPLELLVLYEADDAATRSYLESVDEPSVRGVEVPSEPRLALGTLRNLALRAASGSYVAQWDDDDWHAPARLADQMRVIGRTGRPACVLLRWTIFDAETQSAFISGERAWEGSLVAERCSVPPYLEQSRGEDTDVIDTMLRQEKLAFLDDPHLYIYVYHGGNVWDRPHWEELMQASRPLSREMSARVGTILEAGMRGSAEIIGREAAGG
jgi:glycosyltransferase involved in cell wall biosynthesis